MTQSIEVTLHAIAAGGEAVGHAADGTVVRVADAIPGERVRVEIVESHGDWQEGRLLEILEASPHRIEAPCPYAGPPAPVRLPDGSILNPLGEPRCAGCLWQHIDYEHQLALKREAIVEQVATLGRLERDPARSRAAAERTVDDVIALGDPGQEEEGAVLAYHFCTEMAFAFDKQGRLCLPDRSGGLLAIDACLLHHPQLAQLFAAFAPDGEDGDALAEHLRGVTLAVGGAGDELSESRSGALVLESRRGDAPELDLDIPVNVLLRRTVGGEAKAELLVGEWTHRAQAGDAELIVYPPLGERSLSWPHLLGNEAIPMITAALLEVQPYEYLLDVWAGYGANCVALAEEAATIVAVEEDLLAGAALQANTAGLDSVDFLGGPPRRVLKEMAGDNYRVHAALLTPPDVPDVLPLLPSLAAMGVSRLAIISEDGPGLAGALADIRAGGYGLTSVQPVDLQPHQPTTTLIARFDRR